MKGASKQPGGNIIHSQIPYDFHTWMCCAHLARQTLIIDMKQEVVFTVIMLCSEANRTLPPDETRTVSLNLSRRTGDGLDGTTLQIIFYTGVPQS